MNDKVKLARKWIKALRSGKYEQGNGHLLNKGKYCCLGVLCEISKDKFGLEVREDGLGFSRGKNVYREYLPRVVKDFLNLGKFIPERSLDIQQYLANMNDGSFGISKEDFNGIAEWLEQNLLPKLED